MNLNTDLSELKGVGEKTKEQLQKLNIHTIGDLVFHVPRDYVDYSRVTTVKKIQPGRISLRGQFVKVSARYARRGLHITQAVFKDGTGEFPITWFNQSWRKKSLPLNKDLYLAGELKFSKNKHTITNPIYELAQDIQLHTSRIVPIYKQTAGLQSSKLRKLIHEALQNLHTGSYLPKQLAQMEELQQLKEIHFPHNHSSLKKAIATWQFLDIFDQVLLGFMLRKQLSALSSYKVERNTEQLKNFVDSLGFTLTNAQKRAAWEIIQDMQKDEPMNRLLQGDVGSGKTAVALFASYVALAQGFQVAIVAPTEIVAKQHLESAKELLGSYKPKLLTSSITARQKTLIKNKLANGELKLVVGTHALLQPDVKFKKLSLVVLDEQHRFGVQQRQALSRVHTTIPHTLSMTATPIPRTLALTVFADLDVSVIDELPPGRRPVETIVGGPRNRKSAYARIQTELERGKQAYVVCPLIEESDKLGVTSVEQEAKKIKKEFSSYSVEALHGQLTADEKNAVLSRFTTNDTHILIATTVVEVGVNVPNATVMLIEGAERFGLAQLHQLRGRVGRAQDQAYCMALTSKTGLAKERLAAFASTHDGFKLAELDLKLRGSGELYGLRQSGFMDLDTSVLSNTKLISKARSLAKEFIESYTVKDFAFLQYRLSRIKHSVKRN